MCAGKVAFSSQLNKTTLLTLLAKLRYYLVERKWWFRHTNNIQQTCTTRIQWPISKRADRYRANGEIITVVPNTTWKMSILASRLTASFLWHIEAVLLEANFLILYNSRVCVLRSIVWTSKSLSSSFLLYLWSHDQDKPSFFFLTLFCSACQHEPPDTIHTKTTVHKTRTRFDNNHAAAVAHKP